MNDKLKDIVTSKILQYLGGNKLETNKFEVKRQWYNLKLDKEKFEFLKDITAIVNSYGWEDSFIVFGIDEKSKEIFPADLKDSGYTDQSQIKNIIDTHIDSPIRFDIDTIHINNKYLSVLHLLPSTEKPHYILKYRNENNQVFPNEVFIRSGTSNCVANKSDIDRMYFERTNMIMERNVEVSLNTSDLFVRKSENRGYYLDHPITIENAGTRVIAIAKIELELLHGNETDYKNILFYTKEFSFANLVIQSGALISKRLKFYTLFDNDEYYRSEITNSQHSNARVGSCRVVLSNMEIVIPKLFVHVTPGDFPIDKYDLLF